MSLQDMFQEDGAFFTAADPFHNFFRQTHVFEVGEMFENRLALLKSFRSAGSSGEPFKSPLH